jgi:hypothetical protein
LLKAGVEASIPGTPGAPVIFSIFSIIPPVLIFLFFANLPRLPIIPIFPTAPSLQSGEGPTPFGDATMYTVVLLATLAGSADAPACSGYAYGCYGCSCYGCSCYGCYGCSCYGCSCYGCYSCYSYSCSCYGCYSCYSCYGCSCYGCNSCYSCYGCSCYGCGGYYSYGCTTTYYGCSGCCGCCASGGYYHGGHVGVSPGGLVSPSAAPSSELIKSNPKIINKPKDFKPVEPKPDGGKPPVDTKPDPKLSVTILHDSIVPASVYAPPLEGAVVEGNRIVYSEVVLDGRIVTVGAPVSVTPVGAPNEGGTVVIVSR